MLYCTLFSDLPNNQGDALCHEVSEHQKRRDAVFSCSQMPSKVYLPLDTIYIFRYDMDHYAF